MIRIWEEENALWILVRDNGKGFDSSTLDLTNNIDAQTDRKHSHIALNNTQRRIQLLYGNTYGIIVTSMIGRGTDVLVSLPLDQNADIGSKE